MQVVDQPASRLESLDFWKVNMKRLKYVDIFRTARLTSGILWILRQNERREQKVPFFGWLVPSVNMRGLSKRFYYDFPPYGIVPLAKASKEGKELRQQVPRKGFYLWIQEGGEGESFRKRMQKSERELLGRKWKKQTNRGKWEMMFYMKKICLPAKFEMRRLFSWFGLTHKNSLIILQETTKTDFLFPTIDLC